MTDVYAVSDLVLDDVFALKFVYLAEPADLAGFRAYVYGVGPQKRVPLQETKYAPPFLLGGRLGFTGLVSVYGEFGQELSYTCTAIP